MKRIAPVLALAALPSFLWVSPAGAQALFPAVVLSLATNSRGNLRNDFVANAPDQWYVNGWKWTTY